VTFLVQREKKAAAVVLVVIVVVVPLDNDISNKAFYSKLHKKKKKYLLKMRNMPHKINVTVTRIHPIISDLHSFMQVISKQKNQIYLQLQRIERLF